MVYTKSFEQDQSHLLALLTSCAHLHSDPMVYADLSGKLLGSNELLIELLNAETLEDIAPLNAWFEQQGVDLS